MKKGDKLYRTHGYDEVVEVTVTKAGKKAFETDDGMGSHKLDLFGKVFFTTREAAEHRQKHINAATAFIEEICSFQRISSYGLTQHLTLEEIESMRVTNQKLFAKAIQVACAPGDTIQVMWSTVSRKDSRLRMVEGKRRGYLKAGTLLKVLEIGPYRNATTGLKVALVSDPKDVFWVTTGDVGAVS